MNMNALVYTMAQPITFTKHLQKQEKRPLEPHNECSYCLKAQVVPTLIIIAPINVNNIYLFIVDRRKL